MTLHSRRIHISGIVQGVGFRPFVYALAARLNLAGWVRNTSAGVDIEVDASPEAMAEFVQALINEAPPLARIDEMTVEERSPGSFSGFEIVHSEAVPSAFQPISPDVSTCSDCLKELFNPSDRRYRYPFTNCTNCGPRFTIIHDIPYDRPNTTMAEFPLCPDCSREYQDPLDRRFHAQPVACPVCGPKVWLELRGQVEGRGEAVPEEIETLPKGDAAIQMAVQLLVEGQILAIKGLGGFHLACNANDAKAVSELRRRKLRVDKPFALMVRDTATAEAHCFVNDEERALLESRQRPIVLLKRRAEAAIAPQAAPYQETLGVMLPYSPLHYLLFSDGEGNSPSALIMTSGNLSEEPIATSNSEARERLAVLADAFLMHNRPIHTRCDDSVMRVFLPGPVEHTDKVSGVADLSVGKKAASIPLRRSRGYAPFPVNLHFQAPPLLAVGGELKNTFCITRDRYAFLSHHIGDLENFETLCSFEEGAAHFERLFRIRPEALAYDLHPNYLATRYALERASREQIPALGVQHHHAHAASCMVENGLVGDGPVIAVSFDGTGYGEDGAIWGGEFLVADYESYQRPYHLAYIPLPGGDASVRKPARTALASLWHHGMEWEADLPCVKALKAEEKTALRAQLERGINSPLTSSMGRLFDSVSALIGVRQQINYEGQAAIELEALVDPTENGSYAVSVEEQAGLVNTQSLFQEVLKDMRASIPQGIMAARFHNGLAVMVLEVCRKIRKTYSLSEVVLSGGVWQNLTLLRKTLSLLENDGFHVYFHQQAPANDGGLALGQAVIACHRLNGGSNVFSSTR
jgi:hydrogenase maturation protein HypF